MADKSPQQPQDSTPKTPDVMAPPVDAPTTPRADQTATAAGTTTDALPGNRPAPAYAADAALLGARPAPNIPAEEPLTSGPDMVDITPIVPGAYNAPYMGNQAFLGQIGFRRGPVAASAPPARGTVRLLYVGRKSATGRVSRRTPVGEHIDVVVPGPGSAEENEAQVEDYKSGVNITGQDEEEKRRQGYMELTPDRLHLYGDADYHFTQGEMTDVDTGHLQFLMDHSLYAFQQVQPATAGGPR